MKKNILLIYTGGTIGMIKSHKSDRLLPINFDNLISAIPELSNPEINIENQSITNPIDSSSMSPQIWIEIAKLIKLSYNKYDGFVVLHGTDTMAYTASAISFLIQGLNKPIIFTGSQIPIGVRRTDAKENLITSIEIACNSKICDVCIYFEDQLYRGNRTVKVNTEHFEAFKSPNFPTLAKVGVNIKYSPIKKKVNKKSFSVHESLSNDIAIIKLFPGIKISTIEAIIDSAKGIIIESYGAGNAPNSNKIESILRKACKNDKIIINVSQCLQGSAITNKYESSKVFNNSGVVCGKDMTTEAAVTKLMFLMSKDYNNKKIKKQMQKNLRGEISN